MLNSMRNTHVLNSRSTRIALLSLNIGAVLISFSGTTRSITVICWGERD
jgi:hypothetical protein